MLYKHSLEEYATTGCSTVSGNCCSTGSINYYHLCVEAQRLVLYPPNLRGVINDYQSVVEVGVVSLP